MQITVINLGTLLDDEKAQVKFLLTEEGDLLYGKCLWHKDLSAHIKLSPNVQIIAAGIVPDNMETCSINDNEWGNWKSSGYGVTTPQELRFPIKEAFFLRSQK